MNANVRIAIAIRMIASAIVFSVLLFVIYVSRDHITEVGYKYLNLTEDYQAQTLFVLIDILAMVGKALNSKYFDRATQIAGAILMYIAGAISLLCNILAGDTLGQQIYGVGIVAVFVGLEAVIVRIKFAAWVKAAITRARRSAAAVVADVALIAQPAAQPASVPASAGIRPSRKHAVGCTCGVHNRKARATTTAAATSTTAPATSAAYI